MKATTVKIEGELLEEIQTIKPAGQSVAAFVRHVLRKSIEQERAKKAAEQYREFLLAHPGEAEWLGEWDQADLATPPGENLAGNGNDS